MQKFEPRLRLTRLRLLILDSLTASGEKHGRLIREDLARQGVTITVPTFWRVMRGLVDGKMVQGWSAWTFNGSGNQLVRGRCYKLLEYGLRVVEDRKKYGTGLRKTKSKGKGVRGARS